MTDSANRLVEEANVVLKNKALATPYKVKKTNAEGEVLLSNMPPGDYYATADIEGASGESQTNHLAAGTTLTLEIKLVTARGGWLFTTGLRRRGRQPEARLQTRRKIKPDKQRASSGGRAQTLLNKPYTIGAYINTEILRDCDLVELDVNYKVKGK